MQKVTKKIIIIISSVLAFIIVVLCIALSCVYENGLLSSAHPMNKAKDGQIRVACVGDSLTYGYGISGWTKHNYPVQLGKLLGERYCVNNFGYSGRTALSSGDKPYTKEKLYKQSIDFAPDIVVIMLGSNDTKPKNWRGKDAYVEDYKQIINSYLALDSVEEVYIMLPPPVFKVKGKNPYGIVGETIRDELCVGIREIAEELNLQCIDLYSLFEDKSYMFKDGAHPNAEGAKLIAQEVFHYIAVFPHPPGV